MIEFFKLTIYYPLLNLLALLYNFTGSFGLSVIILTIFVRILLFYFFKKSIIAQKKMAEIQPELKKIQEKYKDDKEKQTKAVWEFMKEKRVNPMSGCLPVLVQFPVLIALYYVFFNGIQSIGPDVLYSFVRSPGSIDFMFLGVFDLSRADSATIALLAGIAQFFQSKYTLKFQKPPALSGNSNDFSAALTSQMSFFTLYFLPLMTFIFGMQFPAGLALYWMVSAIFSILQQKLVEKHYK